MNLGDLTLNIILNIKDSEVKIKDFNTSLSDVSKQFKTTEERSFSLNGSLERTGLRFQGLKSILSLLSSTFGDFIKQYNDFQNATLGLESVSKFKGINPNEALKTVQALDNVKAGLLSVGDASTSIKNLLSANFTLEQSVNILNRLSDAAAFGRQGSLSFGEAVRSATEGIKNGNSILVDNAGVTKNLSVMLQEAGFSAQDLMNASSNAGVRLALFNGIMRETAGQTGDAAKLMNTSQGATVQFEKTINDLKIQFGNLLSTLTPVLKPLSEFVSWLAKADTNVKIAAMSIVGLAAAFTIANSSIPNSVKYIPLISALLVALPNHIRILVGAVAVLTGAILAYNIAMTSASAVTTAATGGLNIALGIIVTGVVSLVSSLLDFTNANDQLKSSLDSTVSATSGYSDMIEKAITVKDLSSKSTKLSADEEYNYQNSLRELASIYPQVVSGIDSKTGALQVNNQALDEAIAKQRELAGIELSAKLDDNIKAIEKSADSFFVDVERTEELRKTTEMLQDNIDDLNISIMNNSADTEDNLNLLKNATIQRDEANKKLSETQSELTLLEDKNVTALNSTSNLVGEYFKFDKILPLLSSLEISTGNNSKAMNLLRMAIGNLGPEGFASLNKINVGLVKHSEVYKVFSDAWFDLINAINSGSVLAVTSAYNKMQSALESIKVLSDKLSKQTQTQKLSTPKISKSNTSEQKDIDIVDEQIKKWNQLIDVYNYVDKARGKNEESILSLIPTYIQENTLIDAQIVKLGKYRETLEKSIKGKPVSLRLAPLDDDFKKQIEEDVKMMYDEWAKTALRVDENGNMVLKKNYNPFNYYEKYKEAMELRKKQMGDELSIDDLLSINLSIQKEINDIIKDNSVEGKLDITNLQNVVTLQDEKKKNEVQIYNLKKKSHDFDTDTYNLRIDQIKDEFQQRRLQIELEYQLELEKLKELQNQKEISSLQLEDRRNALRNKKSLDLNAVDKDQENKQYQILDETFSSVANTSQTIARLFGSAGDGIVNAFQKALEYTNTIKAVMETISFIKSLFSLFSGAAGAAGAAIPVLHSGGVLGGTAAGDIPIIAQEGEGIINRSRMRTLASQFGPNFFHWLNGNTSGSLSSSLGIYHAGGVISPLPNANYRLIEVPYVTETEITGHDLKLTLTRQNKIDSKRSKN